MGMLSALQKGGGPEINPVRPWHPQPQMPPPNLPPPQMGMMPPTMPQGMGPMSNGEYGGMMGAFSGNPQFQAQLQALMQGQGPGTQPMQFTPPPVQMSTQAPRAGGQQGMPPGGLLGMAGLNGRLW